MDGTNVRRPLVPKNSAIPRPSKLPQPIKRVACKRAAPVPDDVQAREEKENPPKRVKIAPPSLVSATAKMTKTCPSGRPKHQPPATKKTSTAPLRSSTAASKPAPRVTGNKAASVAPRGSKGGGEGGNGAGQPAATRAGAKPKRPGWDFKGRLQDVEALLAGERQTSSGKMEELQEQLTAMVGRLGDLEQERSSQAGTIQTQRAEQSAATGTIERLQAELSSSQRCLREATERSDHELELLRRARDALQRSHHQLEGDLAASRSEVTALRSTVAQLTADASAVQCHLDATKADRDRAVSLAAARAEQISSLEADVSAHLSSIARCEASLREEESTRRKLHNTILELKGNIRVFCRVRPLLPSEVGVASKGSHAPSSRSSEPGEGGRLEFAYPDGGREDKKVSLSYAASESLPAKQYDFQFDHIFAPAMTQSDVFGEISQLVQSALDGYNVCIFAYGQTGSGKTFTMEGGEEVECRGMIPRAVEQVFSSAAALREKGWEYKMEASFLEIYNEALRDLLSSSSSEASSKLEIRISPTNSSDVYVTNLTPVTVTSEAQVARLLERAARNRAVAVTQCNERSSRSHSVFRLHLAGHNDSTGETCQGTLNMIDLAGSERLSHSGSVGERLRETKNINKSLSNLGNVIMALANKEQHIPYRNSKLTYLLQNCLGGNSKTLMFVNVSPLSASMQETLCSLRFATKVNQCNIGTASKRVPK